MPILAKNKMKDLFDRYHTVVNLIKTLNDDYPKNQRIKQIQIPSTLTQSRIYHYLLQHPELIGLTEIDPNLLIQGNTRTFDLSYKGENVTNIEVKATGTSNFQRFRPHALTADYIFWMNLSGNKKFDLAIFNPNILLPKKNGEVEISWQKLLRDYEISLIENIVM